MTEEATATTVVRASTEADVPAMIAIYAAFGRRCDSVQMQRVLGVGAALGPIS